MTTFQRDPGTSPLVSTVSVQRCPLQNGEPLQIATTKEPALVKARHVWHRDSEFPLVSPPLESSVVKYVTTMVAVIAHVPSSRSVDDQSAQAHGP